MLFLEMARALEFKLSSIELTEEDKAIVNCYGRRKEKRKS